MFRTNDFFDHSSCVGDGAFQSLSNSKSTEKHSLAYAESIRYLDDALSNGGVSAVITTPELFEKYRAKILNSEKPIVISSQPKLDFWGLHNKLVEAGLIGLKLEGRRGLQCRIHRTAVVSDNAQIGDRVTVGPLAIVEANSVVGDDCDIGPGAVVGAEGLQVAASKIGRVYITHAGGVALGSGVRILTNAVVSKAVDATFTSVDDETYISILCSIGHNSKIGKRCSIAGNALIGGSVDVGDDVWIGPSSTIRDGIRIGSEAEIKLGSVVVKNVPARGCVSGNFAYDHKSHAFEYVRKPRG